VRFCLLPLLSAKTVEFSYEGARLRAYTVIYGSRALESRVMQAQPLFCSVHTSQMKLNLLATFATPKDSTHE
jgi:hypothetical protein